MPRELHNLYMKLCRTILIINEEMLTQILDALLDEGPENFSNYVNVADVDGNTPLMWAVGSHTSIKMTEILLLYGAKVDSVDKNAEDRTVKLHLIYVWSSRSKII